MTLYEECIEALGAYVCRLSNSEAAHILADFERSFPFTKWGRIKWGKVIDKAEINTIDEIYAFLNEKLNRYNSIVYVIWDEKTLPIIQSDLNQIVSVINDVTAVSFDTWIYSPSAVFVIELFHDGEVNIGLK